jgi:hypothetical protein
LIISLNSKAQNVKISAVVQHLTRSDIPAAALLECTASQQGKADTAYTSLATNKLIQLQ